MSKKNNRTKKRVAKTGGAVAVRVQPLVKLRRNWKLSAKWYRGTGFQNNDDANVARRYAIAETLESCADRLRQCVKENQAV